MLALALAACQSLLLAEWTAKSGDVLFRDDFVENSSGWTRLASPVGIMDYANDGYRILVNAPRHDYWSTPGLDFGDMRIEVDAVKLSGPDSNRLGIICRYQDEQNFYFFVISSDGYYGVGKMRGGTYTLLGQEMMAYNAAIQTGGAPNHLRADCIGGSLALYVNDALVGIAQDADFTSGDVGLLAGAFEQAGVDVLFDNFVVIKP